MLHSSRSTFWRFILSITFLFAIAAIWNLIDLAGRLDVDIVSRPSWLGALSALGLFAGIMLAGFVFSFTQWQEKALDILELPSKILPKSIGLIVVVISITGFSFVTSLAGYKKILGDEDWVRLFIFWMFSLFGMRGLKAFRKEIESFHALTIIILSQATFHLLVSHWSPVTSYPFAMGWSETSRYYFPSLFLSESIYGQKYPLPILHPTLHLLLTPPYFFDAPLWVQRFWQVAIRYGLIAATVPAVLKRVYIPNKNVRWFAALWIFLFLFLGPVYFHLTVPVILILTFFTLRSDRMTLRHGSARDWFVILLASAYCGWSRVNWYPMPALLAALLYVLEMQFNGKNLWRYLSKPALWGVVGTLTAFAFQRLYIAISGVTDARYFYTSIASDLLWYRLLPNATYAPGILPAALLVSLPIWVAIYLVLRNASIHPLRITLLIAALTALFAGGLVVSLKIGGGADLHNMDAYFIALLVIFLYLMFAKYQREDDLPAQPVVLHWLVPFALLVPVVWANIQSNIGIRTYDEHRTQSVLHDLQARVDLVNAQGGEILFITQRHLISMGMLQNVTLVPEYEREDLMEMAMGNNDVYLDAFRNDMQSQRFALIIVDPLKYRLLGKEYAFGEENNVWVARVMKHILCNYRVEVVYAEDEIALYVPQTGERTCP